MSVDKKSTYYDAGGIETLAIIEAKLTPEQYAGFLLGNVIKYSTRCNFKGTSERDIEKASVYAAKLSEHKKKYAQAVTTIQEVGDTVVAEGHIAPEGTQSSNGAQPIPNNVTSLKPTPRAKHDAHIDGDQLA